MTQLLIEANLQKAVAKVDEIVGQYGLPSTIGKPTLERMMILATGMQQLRAAITDDMLDKVMQLQGSRLGFRTDKDGERTWKDATGTPRTGYEPAVVKEVMIEALLRGARMVGNEVNIIAKNCYLTKEFFGRAVREFPGVSDVAVDLAVPQMVGEKGALVACWVRYKLNGEPRVYARTKESDDRDLRIAVRVNIGMGTDAILGKAERKVLALLYKELSGMELADGNVDEFDGNPNVVEGKAANKRVETSPLDEQVPATEPVPTKTKQKGSADLWTEK